MLTGEAHGSERVPPTQPHAARAGARPTLWWLSRLRRRRSRREAERLRLDPPIVWAHARQQRAAIKFFNAALRAEQAGIFQAHSLAASLNASEPELAETLRLYGDEEGWHQELLKEFLTWCGGEVLPMGKITRLSHRLYMRARRLETILLLNLMFETIGATTYRLALKRVPYPAARGLLRILTRDESFHVPLNVHFLCWAVRKMSPLRKRRLQAIYSLVLFALCLLPFASRPKAQAFDGIPTNVLVRAYARALCILFDDYPEVGLRPPALLRWLLERTDPTRSKRYVARSHPACEAVPQARGRR